MEVVLVAGEVQCVSTREILKAPCIVPKTFQQIELLMTNGAPRLLVITNESVQETCLVTSSSSNYSIKAQYMINTKVVLRKIKDASVFVKGVLYSTSMKAVRQWRKIRSRNTVYPVEPTTTDTTLQHNTNTPDL